MFLELNLKSECLKRGTAVNVIIPDRAIASGETYKTVWLLHGLSGDYASWMRYTSIERYANDLGVAVVMPDAERSWYTDNAYGIKYFSYIADELPKMLCALFAGMSAKREDNIVAGLSMGGYGAVKLALTRPEQYVACISLSGSLDITRRGRKYDLGEWRSIFGFDLSGAIELEGTEHDVFALARKNSENGKPFPKLYLWCGLEDGLIEINRSFHRLLDELSVAPSMILPLKAHILSLCEEKTLTGCLPK